MLDAQPSGRERPARAPLCVRIMAGGAPGTPRRRLPAMRHVRGTERSFAGAAPADNCGRRVCFPLLTPFQRQSSLHCVLTAGHPFTTSLGSPPALCVRWGVPSSHTLWGAPAGGALTSGCPSQLSSSASPHSLRTSVGLCTPTPSSAPSRGSPCSGSQPRSLTHCLLPAAQAFSCVFGLIGETHLSLAPVSYEEVKGNSWGEKLC